MQTDHKNMSYSNNTKPISKIKLFQVSIAKETSRNQEKLSAYQDSGSEKVKLNIKNYEGYYNVKSIRS